MFRKTRRWWGIGDILGRAAAESGASLTTKGEVMSLLERSARQHPRLFLPDQEEQALKQKLETDDLLRLASQSVIDQADGFLDEEPVERTLTGRRMLGISRKALERIFYLSYAYRTSGDCKYADRAKREMLAAASFEDWNPGHFLDVAEMTAALAVGYDWCYDVLDDDARSVISKAIIEKGLGASRGEHWWIKGTNNWNQVCHGGLIMGALAVWEEAPDLAVEVIERGVNNVPWSMHEYAPDGAYPEGPVYWSYGTSFNVMLIAAIESVLGADFGLTEQPGFMKTPEYVLHVSGPTDSHFNYADCGRGGASPSVPMAWFASRSRTPGILWRERRALQRCEGQASGRMFPLYLIWAGQGGVPDPPAKLHWHGKGANPVAFHRTSWIDPEATFIGVKGGSPSVNHGHMDVGTFVMDANGVRWADDLGSQGYESIESLGMNLWTKDQGAERWQIFRLGSTAHNILTVDGGEQTVHGHAEITKFCDDAANPHTIVDLTPVYDGDLAKAVRGVALRPDGSVIIQDEFEGVRSATVRWAMLTRAEVEITSASTAILKQDGKELGFTVLGVDDIKLQIYQTDPPPNDYDASNEGTRMIGFEMPIDSGAQECLVVLLSPNPSTGSVAIRPLSSW